MSAAIESLAKVVQANCDRSDARHAQEMTLCNYLLAMREYCRWECGLPLASEPDRALVRDWIARREAHWQGLDAGAYERLPLGRGSIEPFDVAAVNATLLPLGWAYGALKGPFGKPQFFLGRLAGQSRRGSACVLEIGREVARDILAAPAAMAGDTIFLRHDAFERWLWSSAEAWGRGHEAGAMRATLQAYGYESDRAGALACMAREQRETLLLHELGEHEAGLALGARWEAYFGSLEDRRGESLARAVRDLLADCLVTLPAIVRSRSMPSAHFWFATFGGLRRELFPRLQSAYEALRDTADWSPLEAAVGAGREHWNRVALGLVRDTGSGTAPVDPARLALA
ncbi:MAG: hypothetical protein IPJ28_16410 [Betaproteobacteria bacterium]|nr:hypothetical protein [Betaproteobacteria bacterium]